MLLPLEHLPLRRLLNQWLELHEITPQVVGEFEDSALMQSFGGDGAGLFPAPTVMRDAVEQQYGAKELGVADGVHERFYAISVDRRLQHPAVLATARAARHDFLS
jgi:LysR family transcriptional activator of nhaA